MPMPGMKPISFLLLKLLLSLGLSVAPPFVAGDEHQFSYSGFSNTNLTLDGAASIMSKGLLMLTNGTARGMGHAFYPGPLRFHNLSDGTVQSFSVSFVFAMVSTYKDISSNGIAQNWEFQDINDNHIGIDINSLHSIQSHDAGFYHDKNGTFESLSLDSQEAMQVWVDYHGEKMQIHATMAPLGMAKP